MKVWLAREGGAIPVVGGVDHSSVGIVRDTYVYLAGRTVIQDLFLKVSFYILLYKLNRKGIILVHVSILQAYFNGKSVVGISVLNILLTSYN